MLNPSEQAMLRRLAVFVGSVDVEAAEAVCTGDGVHAPEVLDLISSLVERSLLYREDFGVHALPAARNDAGVRIASGYGRPMSWIRCASRTCGGIDVWPNEWKPLLSGRCSQTGFGDWMPTSAALQFCLDGPEQVDTGLELAVSLHFWWHTRRSESLVPNQ